ncbi:hypothetical protein D9758_002459 [Tetrapyrgos nigripes]|uniref:USP domain-containing protein n=1 Tax=Tetrapyrgos nigripes TaxID=182062 RepID=A0A8H5GP62_9AGAR|nr:hypothetical protein D9758_002459 [Tetrapyrgos nigripes]
MVKAKSPTPQELYRARKQQEEQEKLAYLPPGLINHGNTCFMNSVLQGLIATRLLSNLVHFEPIPERVQRNSVTTIAPQRSPQLTNGHELGGIYEQKWDAGMPIGDVFVGIMYRAWEAQRHRRRESMSPRALLNALGQKYDQYLDFAQQDAHEFLRILLDAMRMEEFDVIKKRQPPPPKSKRKSLRRRTTITNLGGKGNHETDDKGESEEIQLMSLSDMLFGGKLTSILVCQKCGRLCKGEEERSFKEVGEENGYGGSKHKGDHSRKVSDSDHSVPGVVVEEDPARPSDASEKQLGVIETPIPIRPSSVPPSPAHSGLDDHDPLLVISRRRSLDEMKSSNGHESEDEEAVIVDSQDAPTEVSSCLPEINHFLLLLAQCLLHPMTGKSSLLMCRKSRGWKKTRTSPNPRMVMGGHVLEDG